MKVKRIVIVLNMVGLFVLSGCGKQIFQEKVDPYEKVGIEDSELVYDTYYIKEGSKFYKSYLPGGNSSSVASSVDSTKIFWMNRDYTLLPEYYKGEMLAYATDENYMNDVVLERYKDCGYSLGFYGGSFDEDGYFCVDTENKLIAGSDAGTKLSDEKSAIIRLVSINGEKITEAMVNSAGVIEGLEKDKKYKLEFYAGTSYITEEVKADRRIFQMYEMYDISDATITKNGYYSISLPKDMKSGYYLVDGSGMFKYYDFKRGDKDTEKTKMDEPYYDSVESQMEACSQKYMLSVPVKTNNVKFNIEYSTDKYKDSEIYATLKSPDGKSYDLTPENGMMSVEIAEVIAGKWTINVTPKDLEIKTIAPEATSPSSDTVCDTYAFDIAEDMSNIQFKATYIGDGDIWGVVQNDSTGESKDLEMSKKEKELEVTYDYLGAGSYTVYIYHYADTAVEDVNYASNEENEVTNIITIEQ